MRWLIICALTLSVGVYGCGDDGAAGDGGGGGDGGGLDGATGDGATGDGGGMDGATGDGGGGCTIIMCQAHIRECGDCMDNDGDGLIDQDDPDCLGPCDNNEANFYADIPGSPPTNCNRDCYYDQDDGSGNDDCSWDFQCDPLEPGPDRCMYSDPPPPSADCPDPQSEMCHDFCGPLTPNGCDCFGCCELPARSGMYVYVGTVDPDTREGTCELGSEGDPDLCAPCTPVEDCLNTCERCEICLGRTAEDLPADCFPPPPTDGGVPDGGSPDGSTTDGAVDSGTPPPTCDDGRQACDVPGAPPCPEGYFCITGCCTFFG